MAKDKEKQVERVQMKEKFIGKVKGKYKGGKEGNCKVNLVLANLRLPNY